MKTKLFAIALAVALPAAAQAAPTVHADHPAAATPDHSKCMAMDHSKMNMSGMKMQGMDMKGMDMKSMNMSGMDMKGMAHCDAKSASGADKAQPNAAQKR